MTENPNRANESNECPARSLDRRYVEQVRRVTWIGLISNLLLSVLKFTAGIVGASQAVLADAVHSISDTATDAAVLVGVRLWSAPADDSHPHGHRRIETVITIFIAAVLTVAAIGVAANAIRSLRNPQPQMPRAIALVAVLVSIAAKEALYRWNITVGKRLRSSALVANAWHHRTDAMSSIPAAAAVGLAEIHPSLVFLDPVGALVVSALILLTAWRLAGPAFEQLIDKGAPEKDRRRIEAIARATEGVKSTHAVRTRYIGSGLQVDLHIQVDGDITVRQGHDISGAVKRRLLSQGPNVVDVVVHVEPHEEPDDSPSDNAGQERKQQ